MSSSKVLLQRGVSLTANGVWRRSSFFPTVTVSVHRTLFKFRSFSSTTTCSSLQPPDLPRLAKTAQISLTPNEVLFCFCYFISFSFILLMSFFV